MKNTVSASTRQLSAAELGRMAQVLKLLAHPQRLKIIDLLETSGESPVHDLMARLGLPQSATSSHLTLMRRVGLVESERRGKEVWYRLGDRRSLAILNCMRAKKGA
ncbi:MAG: metalloregulator ArsR/SmtB family transcription factor [Kiritimatiellae bacterium]|nr:metalloregulator ArsR/SmtB family transcription factor [Kiritimatiellia bacterium]